jgi:membrane protease YdiL (CAAX protease family)
MNSTIDRKRIFIFVGIAYAISIALALVLFFNGGLYLRPWVVNPLWYTLGNVLMFAPAVANIATRLITREGWSNTLLRPNFRRGWPFYLAAWFLPALATLVGGAIYYLLFPGRFDPSMTWARDHLGLIPIATGPGTFAIIVRMAYAVLASPLSIPLMFGEEFGWRAYLQPKLMPLGPRKAVLLVGVIWAVWHWPFIFMGFEYGLNYWGAPVVGPLLFVWFCFLTSTFLGWVTLRSGSVWPAALGHGVINAASLLMIAYINGEPDRLIGPGHVGIIGSLGYALLALPIFFIPVALASTAGRNQGAEHLSNPPGAAE